MSKAKKKKNKAGVYIALALMLGAWLLIAALGVILLLSITT